MKLQPQGFLCACALSLVLTASQLGTALAQDSGSGEKKKQDGLWAAPRLDAPAITVARGGATFFVAAPGEHPGWVGISCQKGPESLVDFAVGVSNNYCLSLYNPATGDGIYLKIREWETFCFKRSLGQEIK